MSDYRSRLIAARERLGLTPREMAKRLMTPRQTYEQWEAASRRTPGVAAVAAIVVLADGQHTAKQIAEACAISIGNLRGRLRQLRATGRACPTRRVPPGPVPGSRSAIELMQRARAARRRPT